MAILERLTYEQLAIRCAGDWVLLNDPTLAEDGSVVDGLLAGHRSTKEAIYDLAAQGNTKRIAILSFQKWDGTSFAY